MKLTRASSCFYLMNKSADTITTFKYLDAYLTVQETAVERGALARYNMTSVHLKPFTFSAGSKSRSIENAVLSSLPKRLLFTMNKNTDFNGSVDMNPYKFRYDYIIDFTLYVNGCRVPSKGLSLETDKEKRVMGNRTLFKGSGIYHSITGLQITRHVRQWLLNAPF